jgi:signal transduction histidine kinase
VIPRPSLHAVSRLAIGGMLLAVVALGALAVWANVVSLGHVRGLTDAGVQTSGHLRAAQALGQIDTHTDLLEEGMDEEVLADLRYAQQVLDDSLRRMQEQGVVGWERRLAAEAEPQVRRLGPAIDAFLRAVRTGARNQPATEDGVQEILDPLQIDFYDVKSDPSQLLADEAAAAVADDRMIDRAAIVLIPLGVGFVALCAWQLRVYRRRTEQERERMAAELRVAQRLEAAGQLAAGIAHEINTPIQFVGDSVLFLRGAVEDLNELGNEYRAVCAELADGHDEGAAALARLDEAEEKADLEYLRERVPAAFGRTIDGVDRVATIVAAMKAFGRPDQAERAPADLNDALRSTLIVSQSEYKYVADLETEYGELGPVVCNVSELNQVFLNLIVNAAHAIADAPDDERGKIRVSTARENGTAVVEIADNGPGVPAEIRERIFDPFFTTKDVGRGTGQGLAIARSIIAKHGGSLTLDTTVGRGSTFTVRLPVA